MQRLTIIAPAKNPKFFLVKVIEVNVHPIQVHKMSFFEITNHRYAKPGFDGRRPFSSCYWKFSGLWEATFSNAKRTLIFFYLSDNSS